MISVTGGLVYHYRAFRYGSRLWGSFREPLHEWLMSWNVQEKQLLLIGPSGGYSLKQEFLQRFSKISAIDPDPVARMLFSRRFKLPNVCWSSKDYFSPKGNRFDPQGVARLLEDYPDHAVLFCNFLGQLRYLNDAAAFDPSYEAWKSRLPELLGGRGWASYHDRVSGEQKPELSLGPGAASSALASDRLADSEILSRFYPPRAAPRVELADHLTGDLFPGKPRRFFHWELIPGLHYLIEAVMSPESPGNSENYEN